MKEHSEIVAYLTDAFPAAEIPSPRDHAAAVAPGFIVIEEYEQRQLEIGRPLLDDLQPHTVVQVLKQKRVAEAMRENPGKRIVVSRARDGELLVDVEALRK